MSTGLVQMSESVTEQGRPKLGRGAGQTQAAGALFVAGLSEAALSQKALDLDQVKVRIVWR